METSEIQGPSCPSHPLLCVIKSHPNSQWQLYMVVILKISLTAKSCKCILVLTCLEDLRLLIPEHVFAPALNMYFAFYVPHSFLSPSGPFVSLESAKYYIDFLKSPCSALFPFHSTLFFPGPSMIK